MVHKWNSCQQQNAAAIISLKTLTNKHRAESKKDIKEQLAALKNCSNSFLKVYNGTSTDANK